jgi:hypothetical protein
MNHFHECPIPPDQLHTTELGAARIKKNLSLDEKTDVTDWCKKQIESPCARIERSGKNWYVYTDRCRITVNASSFTIITAHVRKEPL